MEIKAANPATRKPNQIKGFRDAARELGTDESEERFDAASKHVGRHQPKPVNMKANSIPEKQDITALTGEEWKRFRALLLHPPAPNARFRRAAAEHKRIVGKVG